MNVIYFNQLNYIDERLDYWRTQINCGVVSNAKIEEKIEKYEKYWDIFYEKYMENGGEVIWGVPYWWENEDGTITCWDGETFYSDWV